MRFPFRLQPTVADRALQRLRDGRPSESAYGRRLALVLTIPAFDDAIARDIRRTPAGVTYTPLAEFVERVLRLVDTPAMALEPSRR